MPLSKLSEEPKWSYSDSNGPRMGDVFPMVTTLSTVPSDVVVGGGANSGGAWGRGDRGGGYDAGGEGACSTG